MSQSDFGNLGSPLSGSELIDDNLEPWRDALYSMHSGSSRPSYAVAGLMWRDTTTTPWIINIFDGAQDISIGTVNATTNVFMPSGLIANNLSATTAPTVNDDTGDGYVIGSTWVNTSTDKIYVAVDVTAGAAIWKRLVDESEIQTVPFSAASAAGPAYLDFAEDTDNGSNRVRLISPATLASDVTATLPSTTGTLVASGDTASVTNTMLDVMAANTVKANATASSASPTNIALSASNLLGRGSTGNIAALTLGTGLSMSGTVLSASGSPSDKQTFTSTGAGTWTKPSGFSSNALVLIECWGGGGGGGGTGTNGGNTTFGSLVTAYGGAGGVNGGWGGNLTATPSSFATASVLEGIPNGTTAASGDLIYVSGLIIRAMNGNMVGGAGGQGVNGANCNGGSSVYGGGGGAGRGTSQSGSAGSSQFGGAGGGIGAAGTAPAGGGGANFSNGNGGGGGGAYKFFFVTLSSLGATESVSVGVGGTGGTGQNGARGEIRVTVIGS